jgi:GNAT superfamily N-acetyltransferase
VTRGDSGPSVPEAGLAIEQASLRAWPALEEEPFGAWSLRCSEGFSKRANSVQAHAERDPPVDPGQGLEQRVARCEEWYAERRRPGIFRLTPFTEPGLDEVLARRGYLEVGHTRVLHRAARGLPPSPGLELSAVELHDWLREYARLSGVPAAPAPLGRIVSAIALPSLLGVVRAPGSRRVIACGLAVLDRDLLGVFDLVVDADERRKGYGRALVGALATWGVEGGANRVYLQVTEENAPALALYGALGFERAYEYRYRVQPV